MVHFQLEVVKGDSPVRVNDSIDSEAEKIFHGLERGPQSERSEEAPFFFQSSLESEIRDLLSRGVDLVMIISSQFLLEDSLGVGEIPDIFADAGSDDSVLEPSVRSFNLAPGLRRKGVDDFDLAIL